MFDSFALANLVLVTAMVPLFSRVIKNRNNIQDIDLKGAALTTIGLLLMANGYRSLDMMWSLALLMPTLSYWAFVTFYGAKSYFKTNLKPTTASVDATDVA